VTEDMFGGKNETYVRDFGGECVRKIALPLAELTALDAHAKHLM
jgi:hypothetical protein